MGTFVLVHGAFNGAWVWQRVARLLRAAGHEVLTPTLTGAGERYHLLTPQVSLAMHADDVANAVFHEDLRDITLVGHSYGGAVITQVADRLADRLRRLVYLDAAAPVPGQSASGAFTEGTADVLADMSGTDWKLPPLPLAAVGVGDPVDGAWMDARRHEHPLPTLSQPITSTGEAAEIPRSYIVHTEKQALVALFGLDPLATFVERAKREGWRMQSIAAGHDAMFTHPREVAEALIAELA
ncbi:alpha/beta fold hydrolase [Nannocystaceae bacterium ST9]